MNGTAEKNRKYHVVYVEDCEEDFQAMTRAIRTTSYMINLQQLAKVDEAIEYFSRADKLSAGAPDLILLDLKLHGRNSLPILQHIKQQEELRSVPVIMLSASEQDQDISQCYQAGATAYIKKPLALSDLKQTVQSTLDFWLRVAHRPYRWIPEF